MTAQSLTIVLPAYNEEARIESALDELFGYLGRRGETGRDGAPGAGRLPETIDVLVVDDGSTDRTADIVRARPEAGDKAPIGLSLLAVPHGGKGAAVAAGMLAAMGDVIAFADADMATPPDQLPLLVEALETSEMALGSRIQPDGSDMRKSQALYRRLLGRAFHALASAWVVGPIKDTQCGFKGFRRAAARDLFGRQRIRSIVFDVELVFLARRRGYRIAVVPIHWYDRRGSRMRPGPMLAARVAWDLFRIPLLHRGIRPDPEPSPSPRGRAVNARALAAAALPVVAIVVFVAFVGGVLASAGSTLGFDYLAYDAAIRRLVSGQPLYDTSFQGAGGFGLFFYPPTFAPLIVPLALLPPRAATVAWTGLLVAAWLAAVALLPVRRRVRWAIILLGGLMWPLLYAFKLGQVGPLLFLLFAAGWRWVRRDAVVGLSAGLGTAMKVQPGMVLFWALVARRWAAATVGLATVLTLAAIMSAVGGLTPWLDFVDLMRRVVDPITTVHNFTPGAIAFQLGVPKALATGIELVTVVVTLAAVVIAAVRLPLERGYLVAVVGSQLLSPILWDHYALLLLLPVAFGLDRGQPWLAIVPIALSLPLVGFTPDVAYPLAFVVCLVVLLGLRERQTALVASPAAG